MDTQTIEHTEVETETRKKPTNDWRSLIKVHPAADLFPMMGQDELRVLGEDIKANGLKHPITIWCAKETHAFCDGGSKYWLNDQGVLLDGRNRLDAMELVGLPIYTAYYKESWLKGLKRQEGETADIKQQRITVNKEAGPMEGESQDNFLARIKDLEEDAEYWEGETEEEFQERVEHYRSRIDLGVSYRHVFETGLPQNKKIPKTWTIVNDPYAYVVSANIHRRHLTAAQKSELADKLLKLDPTKSDRSIAAAVKVDHKTVGAKRAALSATGEIPQSDTPRVGADGKTRRLPAKSTAAVIAAPTREIPPSDDLGEFTAPADINPLDDVLLQTPPDVGANCNSAYTGSAVEVEWIKLQIAGWWAATDDEQRTELRSWFFEACPSPKDVKLAAYRVAKAAKIEEVDREVLVLIRTAGTEWVGPAKLKKLGIDTGAIGRLVAAGRLRQHPTNPGNVGVTAHSFA